LLEKVNDEHKVSLVRVLKDNALSLTTHVYGCRVIQKALEVLEYDSKLEIISKLDSHVPRCIKDMNGNHVIQKAIRELKLEDIGFIVKAVQDKVSLIARALVMRFPAGLELFG